VAYAANDALFSLNLAFYIALEATVKSLCDVPAKDQFRTLVECLYKMSLPFVGVRTFVRTNKSRHVKVKVEHPVTESIPLPIQNTRKLEERLTKRKANGHAGLRQSQMYYNVKLEAPDGQLLCTMNEKKAQWYVEKGLGTVVNDDSLTIRLKFEPSGRPEVRNNGKVLFMDNFIILLENEPCIFIVMIMNFS